MAINMKNIPNSTPGCATCGLPKTDCLCSHPDIKKSTETKPVTYLHNNPGENKQVRTQHHCETCVCGEIYDGNDLRWSKFHDAAIKLATTVDKLVGGGDKINAIERALEAAYRKDLDFHYIEGDKSKFCQCSSCLPKEETADTSAVTVYIKGDCPNCDSAFDYEDEKDNPPCPKCSAQTEYFDKEKNKYMCWNCDKTPNANPKCTDYDWEGRCNGCAQFDCYECDWGD